MGENNTGKSNILRAIQLCLNALEDVGPTDFFKGEINREIEITLSIELDDELLKLLADNLGYRLLIEPMEKLANNRIISLHFSSSLGRSLRFPASWLTEEELGKHRVRQSGVMKKQNIETLIAFIYTKDVQVAENRERDVGNRLWLKIQESPSEIVIDKNMGANILEKFTNKFKVFSEQRFCPSGNNASDFESFDGAKLADVLSNYKNGNLKQKKKWHEIQTKFAQIFPNLRVDTTKKGNEPPTITIEKESNNQELPISFSGSAVWEMLILITHLVYFDNIIFGIDTPELHCHPHIKRCLMNFLKEKSARNQFIIVTHSTTFLNPELIENIVIVREVNGSSVVSQLDPGILSEEQKNKIVRLLDSRTKDLFFSKGVLLVEGPTEFAAMPIFSRTCGSDFDTIGISLIEIGGSDFGSLVSILESFRFDYLVMLDKDTVMTVVKSIDYGENKLKVGRAFENLGKRLDSLDLQELHMIQPKILPITAKRKKEIFTDDCFDLLKNLALRHNVYVMPSDFEGVLTAMGYGNILKEAQRSSLSKVIVGKVVAEQITKDNRKEKIPEDFRKVISLITDKVTVGAK